MKTKIIIFVLILIILTSSVYAAGEEIIFGLDINGKIMQGLPSSPEINQLISYAQAAINPQLIISKSLSLPSLPSIQRLTDSAEIKKILLGEISKTSPELAYVINNFDKYKSALATLNQFLPEKLYFQVTKEGDIIFKSSKGVEIVRIRSYSFWEINPDKITKEIMLKRTNSNIDWKKQIGEATKCLSSFDTSSNVCREVLICKNIFKNEKTKIINHLKTVGSCDSIYIFGGPKVKEVLSGAEINLGTQGGDVRLNYKSYLNSKFDSIFRINGAGLVKVGNVKTGGNEVLLSNLGNPEDGPAKINFTTQIFQNGKKDDINYARFKATQDSSYIFINNNKKYTYTVSKGAIVLFDKNGNLNINGKGKIDFDSGRWVGSSDKGVNIKLDQQGNIIQIDYSAGGRFEYAEYEITATSPKQFSVCFGKKPCAPNSLAIEKLEGYNVLRSQGIITYTAGATEVSSDIAITKTTLIQTGDTNILSVHSGIAKARKEGIEAVIDAQKQCCSPYKSNPTTFAYKIWESPTGNCGTHVILNRYQAPMITTESLNIIDKCVDKNIPANSYTIGHRGGIAAYQAGKPMPNFQGTLDPEEQSLNIAKLKGAVFGSKELSMIAITDELIKKLEEYRKQINPLNSKLNAAISLINQLNLVELYGRYIGNKERTLENQRVEALTLIGNRINNLIAFKKNLINGYPIKESARKAGLNENFAEGLNSAINDDGSLNVMALSNAAYISRLEATQRTEKNIFLEIALLKEAPELLIDLGFYTVDGNEIYDYAFNKNSRKKKPIINLIVDEVGVAEPDLVKSLKLKRDKDTKKIIDLLDRYGSTPPPTGVISLYPIPESDPDIKEYVKKNYGGNWDKFKLDIDKEYNRVIKFYLSHKLEYESLYSMEDRIHNDILWREALIFGYEFFTIVDIIPLSKIMKLAKVTAKEIEAAGGFVKYAKITGRSGVEYVDNLIANLRGMTEGILIVEPKYAYAGRRASALTHLDELDEARRATFFSRMDDIIPGLNAAYGKGILETLPIDTIVYNKNLKIYQLRRMDNEIINLGGGYTINGYLIGTDPNDIRILSITPPVGTRYSEVYMFLGPGRFVRLKGSPEAIISQLKSLEKYGYETKLVKIGPNEGIITIIRDKRSVQFKATDNSLQILK